MVTKTSMCRDEMKKDTGQLRSCFPYSMCKKTNKRNNSTKGQIGSSFRCLPVQWWRTFGVIIQKTGVLTTVYVRYVSDSF